LTQSFSSDWVTLKYKSSPKDHSRASLVNNRSFINDLPLRINSISEPVLFVDDTSVIISSKNVEDFCSSSNLVLSHTIKQFAAINLVLNLDKTNVTKFVAKNLSHPSLHIGYKEKYLEETMKTKYLGLQNDNHLTRKNHVQQMISTLSGACYAVRSVVHISSINTQINSLHLLSFCYKIWDNF